MKSWRDYNIPVPPGASGEIRTTCPECSPHRKKKNVKCLAVNVDDGVWICHHCGWSGTLKTGQQHESDARESYRKPKVYRKPHWVKLANSELDPALTAWFSQRGISERVLKEYDIRMDTGYMPQEEADVSAICFPYYKNGEVVNVKYRDAKKNFRQEKNAEKVVFNFDRVQNSDVIIITEGEIDVLSFAEAGIDYACSVPDGAPPPNAKNYESKFEYLESLEPSLKKATSVVLAVDNDEPGKKLEEELARRIGMEKCYRVTWPAKCKDANDVLKNFGVSKLKECLARAEPYPVSGLITIPAAMPDVLELYKEGMQPGLSTGWLKVDEIYRVRLGQVTVVTGIPGHGKSEFVDHLIVNVSEKHNLPAAFFSPEAVPLSAHIARLTEKITGKPFDKSHQKHIDEKALQAILKQMSDKYYFIFPEDAETLDIDTVLDLAHVAVLRYGIKLFVLDPWNDLEHRRPAMMTETEYIGQTIVKIRNFARRHMLHFFIVAHPTKLDKAKNGELPVPGPYNISGSANWYNKPDNGLTVYRKDDGTVLIRSWKIKLQPYDGKPGHCLLNFRPETRQYFDYEYEKIIKSAPVEVQEMDGNTDQTTEECPF